MIDDLRAYFTDRIDAIASLTEDLMEIESPTSDREAVNRMGARVRAELEARDAAITIHTREVGGDIVEANWNIGAPGKPIVLVSHMDTVHPIGMLETNPIRRDEGILYGPGSIDMKGSIAVVLDVIGSLQKEGMFPERPIIALMTADEETGSPESQDLIKERADGAALALITEPATNEGALKTWRKSVGDFTLRTSGIASHAGVAHESGLNAIEEAAQQIIKLQRMTNYKVGTTVSVGAITGGSARNTVPDFCEVWIDARAMTKDEMERLTEEIYSLTPILPGASLEITGGFNRPPMERNDLMQATFERAKTITARHGLTLRETGTGGASDGNFTADLGTPTLDGIGPMGNGAHTPNEYLILNSLASSATLIASLLLEWPTE